MTGELHIILFCGGILILALTAFLWTRYIYKAHHKLSRPLSALYALFSFLLVCSAAYVLKICLNIEYDFNLQTSPLALSILFLFPVLVLILKTVVDVRLPQKSFISICIVPTALYSGFDTVLYIIYGPDCILRTPWMRMVDVIIYNYLVFINMAAGFIYIVWKSRIYLYKTSNFFPDRAATDCSCVSRIGWVSFAIVLINYLSLLLSFNSFLGNWPVTAAIMLAALLILVNLGRSLSRIRGVALPADFDWTPVNLTTSQMEMLEDCCRQARDLLSAENSTINISEVINAWLNAPNPSYLNPGITLAQAAQQMHIPANILSSYINKTLDTNFNQWINSYRLRHVKYLLLTTDKTLEEISELSGFTNRSFLARTFKAHEGITTKEFRSLSRK